MIKVIKHGRLRQYTCYNCGCIFTFEMEDIKIRQKDLNYFVSEVECPDCKESNIVSF